MLLERRRLLQLGLGVAAGAGLGPALGLPSLAWADEIKSLEPRKLALHNVNTGETLEALYWDQGAYVSDALTAVNKLLRDHRNGQQHAIDPRLLDLLSTLSGKIETKSPYQVICGYRSPATNAAMHQHSKQVASNSLHIQGMAVDVRVDGLELAHLQRAALALGGGGVGLYPKSNFVHLDVGPVRRWQGT